MPRQVFSCPTPGVDAGCYTTRRVDTLNTEIREIRYPWHPWYGRQVVVFDTVRKQGMSICRCGLEPADGNRSVEVPEWMFDVSVCTHLRLMPSPMVSTEALFELKQLLSTSLLVQDDVMMQAEHSSLFNTGGADAASVDAASSATEFVSATAHRSVLGDSAEGNQATKPATAIETVAPALCQTSGVRSSQRGGQ